MQPHVRRSVACVTTVGLTAILSNVLDVTAGPAPTFEQRYGTYLARPTVELRGLFREFEAPAHGGLAGGGHPDFGHIAPGGPGRYAMIVADTLDAEGKPVFRTTGHKVVEPATNGAGKPIMSGKGYIAGHPGDKAAVVAPDPEGAVSGGDRFWQWFRNVSGVNTGERGVVTFAQDPVTREYVFDGLLDRAGSRASSGEEAPVRTRYTYEIDTTFVHRRGASWFIQSTSDADVWAYINDTLVIDGGAGSGWQGFEFSGILVDGSVLLNSNAEVNAATGSAAMVATNAVGSPIITLNSGCEVEGDVLVGPGGNAASGISLKSNSKIAGSRGVMPARTPIPDVTLPTGMPASSGDMDISGTRTISGDVHAKKVILNSSARMIISGHVRILCDEDFIVNSSSDLEIGPDSSLELYVGGQFLINSAGRFNANTKNPALASVFVFGNKRAEVNSASGVYANLVAPQASLLVNSSSAFSGNYAGGSIEMNSSSVFTVVDTGPWGLSGDVAGAVAPEMTQRIELDRLDWLPDGRTCTLKVFIADRDTRTSRVRLESNIATLNLAALPQGGAQAD